MMMKTRSSGAERDRSVVRRSSDSLNKKSPRAISIRKRTPGQRCLMLVAIMMCRLVLVLATDFNGVDRELWELLKERRFEQTADDFVAQFYNYEDFYNFVQKLGIKLVKEKNVVEKQKEYAQKIVDDLWILKSGTRSDGVSVEKIVAYDLVAVADELDKHVTIEEQKHSKVASITAGILRFMGSKISKEAQILKEEEEAASTMPYDDDYPLGQIGDSEDASPPGRSDTVDHGSWIPKKYAGYDFAEKGVCDYKSNLSFQQKSDNGCESYFSGEDNETVFNVALYTTGADIENMCRGCINRYLAPKHVPRTKSAPPTEKTHIFWKGRSQDKQYCKRYRSPYKRATNPMRTPTSSSKTVPERNYPADIKSKFESEDVYCRNMRAFYEEQLRDVDKLGAQRSQSQQQEMRDLIHQKSQYFEQNIDTMYRTHCRKKAKRLQDLKECHEGDEYGKRMRSQVGESVDHLKALGKKQPSAYVQTLNPEDAPEEPKSADNAPKASPVGSSPKTSKVSKEKQPETAAEPEQVEASRRSPNTGDKGYFGDRVIKTCEKRAVAKAKAYERLQTWITKYESSYKMDGDDEENFKEGNAEKLNRIKRKEEKKRRKSGTTSQRLRIVEKLITLRAEEAKRAGIKSC